jgi:hypothetical protein
MIMKSDWQKRFYEAETAFHELKSFTKRVRLDNQTPEYKELANLVHSLGRDVFYVNEDDFKQG